MITNSFILLDKIGARSEQQIWEQGVRNWNDFLTAKQVKGISKKRKLRLDEDLQNIKRALFKEQYQIIRRRLPSREQWRMYSMLRDEACYLDIETSGYYGDITVIGVYDGRDCHYFIKHRNMDRQRFIELMSRYKMIVTFNGGSFDLPIIEKYFQIKFPHIHVDLRHVAARLGYTGGLKAIERQLGIHRPQEVLDVNGSDAIYLWNQWKTTRRLEYLHKLIAYNEEDIVNLEPLARRFIKQLWSQTFNIEEQSKIRTSYSVQEATLQTA